MPKFLTNLLMEDERLSAANGYRHRPFDIYRRIDIASAAVFLEMQRSV
jgi:hypothetical protein